MLQFCRTSSPIGAPQPPMLQMQQRFPLTQQHHHHYQQQQQQTHHHHQQNQQQLCQLAGDSDLITQMVPHIPRCDARFGSPTASPARRRTASAVGILTSGAVAPLSSPSSSSSSSFLSTSLGSSSSVALSPPSRRPDGDGGAPTASRLSKATAFSSFSERSSSKSPFSLHESLPLGSVLPVSDRARLSDTLEPADAPPSGLAARSFRAGGSGPLRPVHFESTSGHTGATMWSAVDDATPEVAQHMTSSQLRPGQVGAPPRPAIQAPSPAVGGAPPRPFSLAAALAEARRRDLERRSQSLGQERFLPPYAFWGAVRVHGTKDGVQALARHSHTCSDHAFPPPPPVEMPLPEHQQQQQQQQKMPQRLRKAATFSSASHCHHRRLQQSESEAIAAQWELNLHLQDLEEASSSPAPPSLPPSPPTPSLTPSSSHLCSPHRVSTAMTELSPNTLLQRQKPRVLHAKQGTAPSSIAFPASTTAETATATLLRHSAPSSPSSKSSSAPPQTTQLLTLNPQMQSSPPFIPPHCTVAFPATTFEATDTEQLVSADSATDSEGEPALAAETKASPPGESLRLKRRSLDRSKVLAFFTGPFRGPRSPPAAPAVAPVRAAAAASGAPSPQPVSSPPPPALVSPTASSPSPPDSPKQIALPLDTPGWPPSSPTEEKTNGLLAPTPGPGLAQHGAGGASGLHECVAQKDSGPASCPIFRAEELEEATEGWSAKNILGKGSFGTVYKGCWSGVPVAVKRLEEGGKQGNKEYETEVNVLGRISHPNVVRLIGHCPEESSLVYEYLPGGSLQDRLNPTKGYPPLSPVDRVRMLVEVTTALLYLHQHSPPIVHRDMKPDNVLIDKSGNCKLGDVGLARLVDDPDMITYRVAGTVGYIDPETMSTFKISPSIDVYALGLIMLQLLTGERTVTKLHRHISETCGFATSNEGRWLDMAAASLGEMVDASGGEWPNRVANGLGLLGLQCASRKSTSRPDLGAQVLPQLKQLLSLCEQE